MSTPTPENAPTYPAEYRIRLARTEDIPALNALIKRSVLGLQADDYSAAQMHGALGHALGLDTQLLADQTYFLAEPLASPGTVAASGGWSFRRTLFGSDHGPGREAAPLDPLTEPAKIRAIFVDPAHARRGLGSMMLRHCEQAAIDRGFRAFEMGSTLTGLKLHAQRGYIETERVEVPLPNGEHLPIVRMTKSL